MEMNAADQRSWYELAASRQMDVSNGVGSSAAGAGGGGGGGGGGGAGNQLANPASGDEVDMFFPSLDSGNSRARYYQQVHHAAQMHSAYNTAASHGNF